MTILFFINGIYLGGKERRLLELMKYLKSKGQFTIELAVMNQEINYQEIFELEIKIHYLIRKTKNDPGIFRNFYKLCKKAKPDIIHCWDSMTATYAIPACKILGIKLINGMVVDTPVKPLITNKNWLRARVTFPFSDKVIGNSKAGLRAYGAKGKKASCIYNGVDMNRFINLKDPYNIRREILGDNAEDQLIVGMVAAFEKRKDYRTLIEAASTLVDLWGNIRFVFVGGGKYLEEMKNLSTSLPSDKIFFLGKKSNVESIINIFNIGILLTNSKVHGEGISNSIIEYMALKKPVIATRGGGTDEVVLDGENGYLIDPFNKEQLTDRIIRMIKDSSSMEKMGENGYQLIRKVFDINIMAENYISLYSQLINKN